MLDCRSPAIENSCELDYRVSSFTFTPPNLPPHERKREKEKKGKEGGGKEENDDKGWQEGCLLDSGAPGVQAAGPPAPYQAVGEPVSSSRSCRTHPPNFPSHVCPGAHFSTASPSALTGNCR